MVCFKCKMCGGDLNVTGSEKVVECEYCGSRQTVPTADDEKKVNLFNRANRLRIACDFDRAASIYEQIIADFPEEAEAYWGQLLCNYGIEYVDDPATGRKIPTSHRSSFDSVMDDSDLEQACEYADITASRVYREQAKEIEEIRKGIIEVSGKEEPYDIFICYKETDENGERTIDSVIAQDTYDALTAKGYRVFFSRISLEDKLGTEYEPYIFAALHSARVMLVFGTDYEYFNAVWVKNEWSRFLKIMAKDKSKVLIPCYKNLDAYDMPKEFAKLQAQDMGKVGADQDLFRGIDKIFGKNAAQGKAADTIVVNQAASIAPLLKRAFMFLEDGNWKEADEYCEKVLDQEPENALAYLGKLMTELKVHKKEDLYNLEEPFDENGNYAKALRFADEQFAIELKGYISHIKERNENVRQTGIYESAKSLMDSAGSSEGNYLSAAAEFGRIPEFKDAKVLEKECREQTEICRKNEIYYRAISKMTGKRGASWYEEAIKIFSEISGWRDSNEQIATCRAKIAEIKAKEKADRLEAERKAEECRIEAQKVHQKHKKGFSVSAIVCGAVACAAALVILISRVIIPNCKYNEAVELFQEGSYEEAISAFEATDGYKDSKGQIEKCETAMLDQRYDAALALLEAESYDEAIAAFEDLDGYKESDKQIQICKDAIDEIQLGMDYDKAVELFNSGDYEGAKEAFEALGDYKDSASKAESLFEKYKEQLLMEAKEGDTIIFGAYEQDNDQTNGKEGIEWRVLAKEDSKVLVISQYALKRRNYGYSFVTWEECSLRNYLNGTFLNQAFTEEEQKRIATTHVTTDKNPRYATDPGKDTEDKIFLLSIQEAKKYLSSNDDRKCGATPAALYNKTGSARCGWWLRSPGRYQYNAALVDGDGSVYSSGDDVRSYAYVRPALWINLDS